MTKLPEGPLVPPTPEIRRGFRDTNYVQPVAMRMGTGFIDALDELCKLNGRSRRELVEILIENELRALWKNPDRRVAPVK